MNLNDLIVFPRISNVQIYDVPCVSWESVKFNGLYSSANLNEYVIRFKADFETYEKVVSLFADENLVSCHAPFNYYSYVFAGATTKNVGDVKFTYDKDLVLCLIEDGDKKILLNYYFQHFCEEKNRPLLDVWMNSYKTLKSLYAIYKRTLSQYDVQETSYATFLDESVGPFIGDFLNNFVFHLKLHSIQQALIILKPFGLVAQRMNLVLDVDFMPNERLVVVIKRKK